MAPGSCVTLALVSIFRLFGPLIFAACLAPAPAPASGRWDPWKEASTPAPDRYSPQMLNTRLVDETNPARIIGLGSIRIYQLFIGPGLAARCQFHPSCSRYTFTAIQEKGLVNGTFMGAERLLRCNGHVGSGGYPEWGNSGLLEDPVDGKEAPLPWLSRLGF